MARSGGSLAVRIRVSIGSVRIGVSVDPVRIHIAVVSVGIGIVSIRIAVGVDAVGIAVPVDIVSIAIDVAGSGRSRSARAIVRGLTVLGEIVTGEIEIDRREEIGDDGDRDEPSLEVREQSESGERRRRRRVDPRPLLRVLPVVLPTPDGVDPYSPCSWDHYRRWRNQDVPGIVGGNALADRSVLPVIS